jgi:hypothetical protein
MVKCPICQHQAESYETLFNHIMHHRKNDITSALLRLIENVDAKLSDLEKQMAVINEKMKIVES